MDKPRRRQKAPTRPVPRPRLIGFIGAASITDYEAQALKYIGRCLAVIGHTLLIATEAGAAGAVREGVGMQGGKVRIIEAGVIETADRTLLYPDTRLLERVEHTHKDLYERDDVVVIYPHQLDEFLTATKETVTDYGLDLP